MIRCSCNFSGCGADPEDAVLAVATTLHAAANLCCPRMDQLQEKEKEPKELEKVEGQRRLA